jgi:hypothetical protein
MSTTARIRPLGAADAPAYKRLRDEALRCAPEAFVADYASARLQPALAYAQRFGPPLSGNATARNWSACV